MKVTAMDIGYFFFGTLAKLYATSIEDRNVVCLILISPTAMMTTETGKMPYIKSQAYSLSNEKSS